MHSGLSPWGWGYSFAASFAAVSRSAALFAALTALASARAARLAVLFLAAAFLASLRTWPPFRPSAAAAVSNFFWGISTPPDNKQHNKFCLVLPEHSKKKQKKLKKVDFSEKKPGESCSFLAFFRFLFRNGLRKISKCANLFQFHAQTFSAAICVFV